jgi:hypothetical protein
MPDIIHGKEFPLTGDDAIELNATYDRTFTYMQTTDGVTPTTPVDLTGYRGEMQIRPSKGSDTVLYTATSAQSPARIELGGALGTVRMLFPVSDVSALTFESGFYDLLLIRNSDEYTIRFMEGPVTTKVGVTVGT